MKFALIHNTRICQFVEVQDACFPVAAELQWIQVDDATTEQDTFVDGHVVTYISPPPPPPMLDLATLQARMDVEGVWDTYVNFMFGTTARRNAFMKTMFIGHPISPTDAPFLQSMTGAGISAAAIARITA